MVPEPVLDGECASNQILMDRELKYNPPDIRQLTKGKLSDEMVRIIKENAEVGRMSDEVKEYWEKVEESNAAVAIVEEADAAVAIVDCCLNDGNGSGDGGG